ncbi:MAG: hypothetical protein IKS52_05800, partial [Clostridia bacterium]|nr:hypothetical protein [Clostridia bacterium]
AILLCATIGILSGIHYLNTRKAMYAGMIVLGMICIVLGRLYQCTLLLTGGSLTERFQVGALGILGAFSFFFSANFGQIDSLVDDGRKNFRKYRIIALIGPLCMTLMLIPILLSPASRAFKISCAFVTGFISAACYFHVKHLLIPDVDYGVVRCLRWYNALAMILSVLSMLELIALAWDLNALFILSGIGLCAASLAMVPMMDKGVKKWQT